MNLLHEFHYTSAQMMTELFLSLAPGAGIVVLHVEQLLVRVLPILF